MKFFLASALKFVTNEFIEWYGPLKGKKVIWIQNAVDLRTDIDFLKDIHTWFLNQGVELIPTDLRKIQGEELTKHLRGADVIYVTGGDCFYLLHMFRVSGFDKALTLLQGEDIVYASTSAGTVVMGTDINHRKVLNRSGSVADLESTQGLGYINGCILAHWQRADFIDEYKRILELKNLPAPLLVMEDTHYIIIDR